jgi:hypothetical protein
MPKIKKVLRITPAPTYPPLDAWSYSRYATWCECPAKARFKYIDKLPEPSGPAAARGTEYHSLAEDYLAGRIPALPTELNKLKKQYAALRKEKPEVEVEFALSRQWQPVHWFAKGKDAAWCRVKLDAVVPPTVTRRLKKNFAIAKVYDHKTGGVDKDQKLRPGKEAEFEKQLELYALAALLRHPAADAAETYLLHIDAGAVTAGPPYMRSQIPQLIDLWEGRTAPMLKDVYFVPRPGPYCNRCHYRKGNGGPCIY